MSERWRGPGRLKWTEALKLGHEKLDADHQAIITLADDIDRDLIGKSPIESLRVKLQQLYMMLTEHCVFEEDLMDLLPQNAYAREIEEHKRGHDRLLNSFLMVLNLANRLSASAEMIQPSFQRTMGTLSDLFIGDSQLLKNLNREGKIPPA